MRVDSSSMSNEGPVRIVDVVRRLHGGSQAKLVRGEDGCLYILKCFPNPQGPNVLANEWIGSIILNGLGIKSADPIQIVLEDCTIGSYPRLQIDYGDVLLSPPSGIHFGSRMAGNESGPSRPQDYKPRNVESLSINRFDYLKVRLIDLWANTQDTRQYVIVPTGNDRMVTAHFIDHGHMFGGPSWDVTSNYRCERLSTLQMLGGIGWQRELIDQWTSEMVEKIPALLSAALLTLPKEWYTGSLIRFERTQLKRLRNFRARLPF